VAVMSQVFRQALDISVAIVTRGGRQPSRSGCAGRTPLCRTDSANCRSDSAIRASRSRHPAHADNDPGRSSSMMADFLRNLPQIAKTIPAAW
jgi:hypothetical protein